MLTTEQLKLLRLLAIADQTRAAADELVANVDLAELAYAVELRDLVGCLTTKIERVVKQSRRLKCHGKQSPRLRH